MHTQSEIISALSSLRVLPPEPVIEKACGENRWFTSTDIRRAAEAITCNMLDPEELSRWASDYIQTPEPQSVVVVMAGNIPFAGFFDMLCVMVSGHNCLIKFSSKDRVLMEYAVERIRELLPGIYIEEYGGQHADAVIASGSDNSIRHIRYSFGNIKGIYRGNRSSVAVLTGKETAAELDGLAGDIFSYNGLGCRNVSHLLLPIGYDLKELTGLAGKVELNPKYQNNYRQRKALLTVSGESFHDMGGWIAREDEIFPAWLSEITYSYYNSLADAACWVNAHSSELQCVVTGCKMECEMPFTPTPFGHAQSPALSDYPDMVDIMQFLSEI